MNLNKKQMLMVEKIFGFSSWLNLEPFVVLTIVHGLKHHQQLGSRLNSRNHQNRTRTLKKYTKF